MARPEALFASRTARAAVVGAAIVVAFAWLGSRGLYATTEGRYAECAREMLATRDWITPRLEGRPHWTKPPLAYWAMAAGIAALGRNAWAVRVPGAVAFVALTLALVATARRLWDDETGWLAGLVWATSPFALAGASVASTDMLLALWSMLVVAAWVRARQAPAAGRWPLAMAAAAGLGFLTKGPPALLAPASVLAFHALERRAGRPVPRLRPASGLAVFAVVGLAWYVVVVATTPGLLGYFVGDEVVGRVFTPKFHRNPQWYGPLTMYAGPLALGAGPWALVAAMGAWRARRRRAAGGAGDGARLCATWLVVTVGVLSISRSRLTLYVLPVFPAVVMLVARGVLAAAAPGPPRRRLVTAVGVVSALALVLARAAAARHEGARDMAPLARACARATAPGPRRAMVDSGDRLYGLMFYLDGHMERVALPADTTRVRRAARRGPLALVVDRERARRLEALARTGLVVVPVARTARYTVVRVQAPPGAD